MATSQQTFEQMKHVGDAVSVGVAVGTVAQILPAIAALLTIVWMAIRIYESDTVQRLLGRTPPPSDNSV